jgi:hypothetical protein
MTPRRKPPPDIPAAVEAAYLSMTDGDPEGLGNASAYIRIALEVFCDLREHEDDDAVYVTLARLLDMHGGRPLVLVAAQAVVELHELGYTVPIEDDDEGTD